MTLFLDKKQNKKEREGQCLPSLNLWIMTELDVETIGSYSSLGIRWGPIILVGLLWWGLLKDAIEVR